jgi:hypothetical protein
MCDFLEFLVNFLIYVHSIYTKISCAHDMFPLKQANIILRVLVYASRFGHA